MTAVEWLGNEWLYLDQQFDMCLIDRDIYWDKLRQIQEQAKEMDKEQKIKFAKHCLDKSIDLDILMAYNQVEIEYTNQTFKSE